MTDSARTRWTWSVGDPHEPDCPTCHNKHPDDWEKWATPEQRTLVDRLRDASSRIGYYDGRGHWQPGGAGLVTEAADAIEQAEARLRKAELLAEAVDAFAVPTAGFLMDRLSHKYIAPTILSAWITALETSRDALAAFRNTEDAK